MNEPADRQAAALTTEDDVSVWELVVAYDGTDFRGWQIQPNQRTVQDQLQARLRLLFGCPELRSAGSSRTDAGVHALDQHVSFRAAAPPGMDSDTIRRKLNRWLPNDIEVRCVRAREPGFHARHDACAKAYTYTVYRGEKCNPLFSRFVWHCPRPMDTAAMTAAAAFLHGEHDFASFGVNPKREIESTVRTIHRLDIIPEGDSICFNVVGNSFLYRMVRGLVGYLVSVGLGQRAAENTARVLAARDRCAACDSAPAAGLFLARVFFETDAWRDYRPVLPPFAFPQLRARDGDPTNANDSCDDVRA